MRHHHTTIRHYETSEYTFNTPTGSTCIPNPDTSTVVLSTALANERFSATNNKQVYSKSKENLERYRWVCVCGGGGVQYSDYTM